MAEEDNRLQTEEQGSLPDAATNEATDPERLLREEDARIRAKYPQAPNARSALAQRRLAQAQSKKFFDSGDYNMAKATLRNSKLKKSGIAESSTSASTEVSSAEQAQISEVAEKQAESQTEEQADAQKVDNLQPVGETTEAAAKLRAATASEAECDAMNADEAQRVIEHPPPPVLLPAPEPVAPSLCVGVGFSDAFAAVSLRSAQRRSVQWPLGHADFAAAGVSVIGRDCGRLSVTGRARPLSSLVEAEAAVQRRDGGTTAVGSTDLESQSAESERQRVLRHRHSTVSGTFNAAPLDLLGNGPSALLRGPAPTAVPMRRVSLIQQQNRGLLNVS